MSRSWPSTADEWIEYVKDAYAASLITERVFERSINHILRNPEDANRVMTDMPMPFDLEKVLA